MTCSTAGTSWAASPWVALVGLVGGDEPVLILGQQYGVAELGRLAGLALADRPGVRVGQRNQPVADDPVAGKPLTGLREQPMALGGRLVQPGHKPAQPPVLGPLAQGAAGVARHPLRLRERPPGNRGDLGGEPVNLRGRLPGAPPQGLGDLLEPPPGRVGPVRYAVWVAAPRP